MKKIAILLVFTLGTFIVNAQSVVEGTKFMDNWSVGVNAGAVTPLTHASFFKGMRLSLKGCVPVSELEYPNN